MAFVAVVDEDRCVDLLAANHFVVQFFDRRLVAMEAIAVRLRLDAAVCRASMLHGFF